MKEYNYQQKNFKVSSEELRTIEKFCEENALNFSKWVRGLIFNEINKKKGIC
jgi:hypothetical protein